MSPKTGRYSSYIRPFSYVVDLLIVNLLAFYYLPPQLNNFGYHTFLSLSWMIISSNVAFYEVYRFTKEFQILGKLIKQYLFFLIFNFAYLGFFYKFSEPSQMIKFISLSLIFVSLEKFAIYFFLRRFRVTFGGNFRRVIIVGHGKQVEKLIHFFNENPDYGYKLEKVIDVKEGKKDNFSDCFDFALKERIDEIYCSISSLSNNELNLFVDFTDNNLKKLKLLPDNKNVLSRNLILDYYDYIPIVSLRNIPLDKRSNQIIKRVFDITFSLLIILLILSWLMPLVALLIKLESKGPIFFKQKRNGLNYEEFYCYKFRSMHVNPIADIEQVQKNDPRVTRLGAILRKTSLDELPQFFNVLLGDMSVVGPRPHMVSHTEMYAKSVDKFMVRHFIKPGITGLAQTNGFRGEVENNRQIINRVKYDIFYIENWSVLLDIKIIFSTVLNAIKGEEKAY
ncbi:Undecaprenyl-phosphate glucose phosphotransferase [Flavobacterium sp. 9AF]|uniref:undecaprenyl-phosphate glucose phosphotransferase n=1 Tax=Flavobacterium sp. 9AF TaxID=2653142 RepID=UPI0012F0ABAE|nr:undecaprenyl-phosphate glucose phosphotransferase [Flavobacterium sp. 9AF]VXC09581.1 Undecaprenyl-phosphate glucose phosphotransferase [Flavobacterium sp. 9AF]